jgi:hypothetical protein
MLTDVGAFVEVTDTHIDANWVVSVLWAIDEAISCRTSRDATLSPCCRGVLPSWERNTLPAGGRDPRYSSNADVTEANRRAIEIARKRQSLIAVPTYRLSSSVSHKGVASEDSNRASRAS